MIWIHGYASWNDSRNPELVREPGRNSELNITKEGRHGSTTAKDFLWSRVPGPESSELLMDSIQSELGLGKSAEDGAECFNDTFAFERTGFEHFNVLRQSQVIDDLFER